jgi:hypothetical protein
MQFVKGRHKNDLKFQVNVLGNQIKEDEMDEACSRHGRHKKAYQI